MPESGDGWRSTMLAVGKPSSRPSLAPCATRPLRVYGWPSSRSARPKSPAASAARIAELDTRSPPTCTSGIASSSKPRFCSAEKSPARRAPKRKSRPTSSQRTPSAFFRTSSMKAPTSSAANRASKRAICVRSTPAAASSSSLSRRRVRRAGARSGAKNSRGCGSKVRTQEDTESSRALAVTRSMSARWPRCTPSKLPMVSAQRLRVGCNEPCVTTMDVVKMLNYSEIMKTLEDQMSTYAAYHQDARNKATHFIGVPVIVLSLMIPLAWVKLEPVSAAMVITGLLVAYYLVLDVPLGLAMLVVMGALLWLGQYIADLGALWGWIWFGVLFVGGWIL